MKKTLMVALALGIVFGTFLPVIAKSTPKPSPTALCKDGTYSYAVHHQGACSHHKGVKKWYK